MKNLPVRNRGLLSLSLTADNALAWRAFSSTAQQRNQRRNSARIAHGKALLRFIKPHHIVRKPQ